MRIDDMQNNFQPLICFVEFDSTLRFPICTGNMSLQMHCYPTSQRAEPDIKMGV